MGEADAARERLVFALDVTDVQSARAWIARLRGEVGLFKVGLELFASAGPDAVRAVHDAGARCFLDLKLHDIPETVSRAVAAVHRLGVAYVTVHASGGRAMLARAVDAAGQGADATRVLAVTVLTSMDDQAVAEIGLGGRADDAVERLGSLAMRSGVAGLVCSAREVGALRAMAPRAVLVTPGIRLGDGPHGDQARVSTPACAIRDGADLLVVGRPIRDAADPVAAARQIVGEIARAT